MNAQTKFSNAYDEEPSALPPANKRNWIYVYVVLGTITAVCVALALIYREMPKRSAPVTKRAVPAVRNVFATVLSPLDSLAARAVVGEIAREIGADSAATQMIIGGTAVHKRCMSLDDFATLTRRALAEAQAESLKRQALLLSHVAGIITADTLPTKLYLIGRLDENGFAAEEKRLAGATGVMGAWQRSFGNIAVVAYVPRATSPQGDSARSAFLELFRKNGHAVEERSLPQ